MDYGAQKFGRDIFLLSMSKTTNWLGVITAWEDEKRLASIFFFFFFLLNTEFDCPFLLNEKQLHTTAAATLPLLQWKRKLHSCLFTLNTMNALYG